MAKKWTAQELGEMSRAFQASCVLLAGAELDVFGALAGGAMTAEGLAEAIDGDLRATTMLADALSAMELLVKSDGRYSLAPGTTEVLSDRGAQSELPMMQHLANCLRSWVQLANVVRTGRRADKTPSVRGPKGDLASFIEAMEVVSRQAAPLIVKDLGPPEFRHLLDVGGGPATWTIAFLRARPAARATLFDLPDVLPIAEMHLREAGLLDRVTLAGGNFEADPSLPAGADLAWVSAIVHMNSREENRSLFAKVHAALASGGKILIRDIVMDPSHVRPTAGALFAINMLVNTPGGGTFSFEELSEDLAAAGFAEPVVLRKDEGMGTVIAATKG